MYLTIYYFCIILNFLITILIVYIFINFFKNKYNVNFPLKVLKSIIPYTSTTFFLPIFFCFLSSLDCSESKTSFYSNDLKCYTILYYINAIIGIISVILFIPINILSLIIYYDYSLGENLNSNSKTTSKPEVFFGICKICISFIFIFSDGDLKAHYLLIGSCVLFSFILVCLNFVYPRYNNNCLIFINQFLSLTFFWASFILLIGRFTLNNNFNGCLGMFFIAEPIFCLILIFRKKNIQKQLLHKIGREENYFEMLNHIKSFIYLIDNKENFRNAYVLLKGYIVVFEENCTIEECPLKKYLNCIKFGNNGNPFLFQHAEFLFSICLAKFPNIIEVRFAYALFLIQRMNKKKQAKELLKGLEDMTDSIEEQFIIYRCKKIMEDDFSDLNNENNCNLDIIRELEYKNLKMQFLNLIANASNLYIEFWSQLYASHSSGSEDLSKLNECGTKINIIIEEIDSTFDKMKKIKNNDFEIVKTYCDFINEILNDKEKGLKFRNLLDELGEALEIQEENEFININTSILSLNDTYQYIICSANNDNFGLIINLSLSICSIFGFEYNELIGKSLDIIMPDIYQKEHKKCLKNTLYEFKKLEMENKKNTKIKEVYTFGRNKSKYLIEVYLKNSIIQTENNELFFVGSISKDLAYYHTNYNQENIQYSYILTNKNLIIQNFTANAVTYLGLSSGVINNNIEITFFIKQFYEEFLQIAIECNNQLTPEQKLKIKRNILSKRYKNPVNIIWRRSDVFESKFVSAKIDLKSTLHLKTSKVLSYTFDDIFSLVVNEVIINDKIVGYVFRFEKITYNNYNSSKILPSASSLLNKQQQNNSKTDEISPKRRNKSNDIYCVSPQKADFRIYPNYIPNSNFNFKLDITDLTFKGKDDVGNDSLRSELQHFVMEKFEEENKKSEKNENEEEEEESQEDDENYSSENDSFSNSKQDIKNPLIGQKENNINDKLKRSNAEKPEDEFYHVNFSKIKFLKYDYLKHILYEVKDWEKNSLIQIRMNESLKIKTSEEEKEKNFDKENISLSPTQNLKIMIGNNNQENTIIKEIEYALKKKESLESISLLNKNSIFVFLLFILIGIISLYYIISSSKKVKKIGNLVTNSYRLLIFNSIGSYYVRELILLNNENYTLIPSKLKREQYIKTVSEKTLLLFEESHNLLTGTTGSNLKLSKKNKKILFEDKIETQNIQNDYSIKSIKSTMQSAFIEASTSLFNIATKNINEIIPTEQDTFYFLKNSLNILMISFYKQGEVYMDELYIIIKYIEVIFIIGYILIFLVLIFIYFILTYSYNGVSKKKESYIEVFFKIGTSIIKSSLDKCEHFSKKLKKEEDDYDGSFDNEDNYEESFIKKKENLNDNHNNSRILDRENRDSQLSKIFKIKIAIVLFLILIFFTIIFILYYLFLEQIKINEKYFQQELIIENAFYIVFNCLREYLFDKNSTVKLELSYNLLMKDLEKIYELRRETFSYMNEQRNKLPYNFIKKYSIINQKSPCDLKEEDYFENNEECLNYINGVNKYGIFIMNSYFVEEIRFAKEISFVIINSNQTTNNLTLTGTNLGKSLWPKNKKDLENYINNDPINYFNIPTVNELNIVMSNLLIPYLASLKQVTLDVLNKYLNEAYFIFVILMITYLCLITLLFLFVWIPFVRELNSIIYKTKGMLSIIPKEVLASISNIDKLLDLDKSATNSTNINQN